jgi:GT2 family glycosyltransferase/glycosyltransferase involved in cell wall biosynthesis
MKKSHPNSTHSIEVSFVIPLYNHWALTQECLATLEKSVPSSVNYEIVLVDDASSDETRDHIQNLPLPLYSIILNEKNRGYAYSNNIGVKAAKGRFVCLLNNDLEFSPDWLEPMLDAFAKCENTGIAGNIQSTIKTGEIDHSGITFDINGKAHHSHNISDNPYTQVPAVTGACLLIQRELFTKIGGFDETFVNGCEDIDLCFKVSQLNNKIIVSNKSLVRHHVSASRGQSLQDEKNCRYLFEKWHEKLAVLASEKWINFYLSELKKCPSIFTWSLFWQAISQKLKISRNPPEAGVAYAKARMREVHIHWEHLLGPSKSKNSFPSISFREFDFVGFPAIHDENGRVWIREEATITLPANIPVKSLTIEGVLLPAANNITASKGKLGLRVKILRCQERTWPEIEDGSFKLEIPETLTDPRSKTIIRITLLGVGMSNTLAYFGRITEKWPLPKAIRDRLQSYRFQQKNKRLQLGEIQINKENILNFNNSNMPIVSDFVTRYSKPGVNLVGWFNAELGVGESARYMANALSTTSIPHSLVTCKLNCLAAKGDHTYDDRLETENIHPVNIFHIDAAQAGDIDHCHGKDFRKDKHNIAYWAWELPEFPDSWLRFFRYFDEIWTPSHFVTEAISRKSPIPVLTMPHPISFQRPTGNNRAKFNLPENQFLFLFMYDLNSYQERKNPQAVIDAYRKAFPDPSGDVGLVMKVHGITKNESDFENLKESVKDLHNVHLVPRTLPRAEVYALQNACDCFVSLHRSEGFGLSVAESMYLQKPVISTDWSATSEFVNPGNGCPVNYQLIKLEKNFGPYGKGQTWADPDTDHAAWFMRKVFENKTFRDEVSQQAKRTIKERFSLQTIGNLYTQRLRTISLW